MVVGTYCDKRQGQEDHANHGQNANVIALVDGSAALFDRTSAKELVAEIFNLLSCALITLKNFSKLADDLVELGAKQAHTSTIFGTFGGIWGRMRPEQWVVAGPEIVIEGVDVGSHHSLDARVDDRESVVGPKISPNISKVFVLEEELVAKPGIKHKLGLVCERVD